MKRSRWDDQVFNELAPHDQSADRQQPKPTAPPVQHQEQQQQLQRRRNLTPPPPPPNPSAVRARAGPSRAVVVPSRPCRSVDCYEKVLKINEGTFGVVYKARDRTTGEGVALKQVKLENTTEGFPVTALREINVLLRLRHAHIVSVREMVVGSTMDKIFMVMDFMEHDLKGLMNAMTQPFTASEARGGFRRRPALGAAPTPRRGLAFALR